MNFELSLVNLNGKKDLVHKFSNVTFSATDGIENFTNTQQFFIKRKELADLGFINSNWFLVKSYVEVLEILES